MCTAVPKGYFHDLGAIVLKQKGPQKVSTNHSTHSFSFSTSKTCLSAHKLEIAGFGSFAIIMTNGCHGLRCPEQTPKRKVFIFQKTIPS